MRRAIAALLAGVRLSGRDRRAVDETIADWRFERDACVSGPGKIAVDVRGAAAVTTAVLRIAAADSLRWEAWSTAFVAVLLSAGFVLPGLVWALRGLAFMQGMSTGALLLSLFPSWVSGVLAPMLAAVLAGRRIAPVPGTVIAGVTIAVVLVGWVTPESNQLFRQTMSTYTTELTRQPHRSIPRGPAEMTLVDLLAAAAGDDTRQAGAARSQLLLRSGLIGWVPVCCVLGVCVRQMVPRWRRARWAAPLLLPVLIWTVVAGLWMAMRSAGVDSQFQSWSAVAATAMLSVPFALAAPRQLA